VYWQKMGAANSSANFPDETTSKNAEELPVFIDYQVFIEFGIKQYRLQYLEDQDEYVDPPPDLYTICNYSWNTYDNPFQKERAEAEFKPLFDAVDQISKYKYDRYSDERNATFDRVVIRHLCVTAYNHSEQYSPQTENEAYAKYILRLKTDNDTNPLAILINRVNAKKCGSSVLYFEIAERQDLSRMRFLFDNFSMPPEYNVPSAIREILKKGLPEILPHFQVTTNYDCIVFKRIPQVVDDVSAVGTISFESPAQISFINRPLPHIFRFLLTNVLTVLGYVNPVIEYNSYEYLLLFMRNVQYQNEQDKEKYRSIQDIK
jgi:hypothetical protein